MSYFLKLHPNWVPPPPPPPLPSDWLEKARKENRESKNRKFEKDQKESLEFSLEHAKIPAPRNLSPGWGPIKV
jgi:hypothetical protein